MSQNEYLLGFFPITAAGVTQENTSWAEVMITGEKMKNGGKTFTITRDDLDTYAADIRSRGTEKRIPLDYDHSYAEGGSTLASGWFTGQAEIREQDGKPSLWAEVQWTPKAADAIRSGEYAYISPEFSFQARSKDGVLEKARQLLAATLTNRPFFDRMAPVQLASRRDNGGYEPTTSKEAPKGAEETTMTDTIATTVRKNLGLPDDADDAAVTAAIAAKDEQITKLEAAAAELEKRPNISKETVDSLTATAERVTGLEKKLHEQDREHVLRAAIENGQILPAQKDSVAAIYDADPAKAVAMIEATPKKTFKAIGSSDGGSDEDVDVTAAERALRIREGSDAASEEIVGSDLQARANKILADAKVLKPTMEQMVDALRQASLQAA